MLILDIDYIHFKLQPTKNNFKKSLKLISRIQLKCLRRVRLNGMAMYTIQCAQVYASLYYDLKLITSKRS